MKKYSVLSVLVLLFLFGIDTRAQQENPDANNLVKEAALNTQKNAIANYYYRLRYDERYLKGASKKHWYRIFEVVIPSVLPSNLTYQHRLLLVEENGRQIPVYELASARKRLSESLEKDEKHVAELEQQPVEEEKNPDGGYFTFNVKNYRFGTKPLRIGVLDILEKFEFSNPKTELLNERRVIVLDFKPKEASVFGLGYEYLSRLEGQIWIDAEDKRVVRAEGFTLGGLEQMKSKNEAEREAQATFLYVQKRVREGYWFPERVRMSFIKNPELWNNAPVEIEFNFSDYSRFNVEVKDTNIDPRSAGKEPQNAPPGIN